MTVSQLASLAQFEVLFPFFGAAVVAGLLFLAFNIWMLIDAIQRPAEQFSPPESRTWWIVGLAVGLVLGTIGFVAALVYFFLVRKPAVEGRVKPKTACASCGTPQRTGSRFCHVCGAAVTREET